ncbi:MAG: mannose-1-phosphate guanylyltransferase [Gemmatimonadota bacterium]
MSGSSSSSKKPDPHLWITILAGGAGTRFWPLSTPNRPKQLLPLAGDNPLILDTLNRARGIAPDERIRILTGRHLVSRFQKALGDLDPTAFLVEPRVRGTGPVLTWAAWVIHQTDPDAVMVSLHADHAIQPWKAFQDLIRRAGDFASRTPKLFTVSVHPTRPETGYGYVRPGEGIPGGEDLGAFLVRSFVEKPDTETARKYVEEGYLWNSGIFLWRADLFLEEVRDVAPELGELLPLLEAGDTEEFFRRSPNVSVDEAILERSRRVASIPADFRWDDVGAWEALGRTREPDGEGNITVGSVHLKDARDNIVMAEEGEVVLFGVEGLAVIRSGDIILVARRERTPELKKLLEELPPSLRSPDET